MALDRVLTPVDPAERDAIGLGRRAPERWASRHEPQPPTHAAEVQRLAELGMLGERETRYLVNRAESARRCLAGELPRFPDDPADADRWLEVGRALEAGLGWRHA